MGIRENKVEWYLREQIQRFKGNTRKWVSPGRDGVPDQIVFVHDRVFFCEVKTVDGTLEASQSREHHRLRLLGATVCTVYGEAGVNCLIKDLQIHKTRLKEYYV